jgi:hypothetical protein
MATAFAPDRGFPAADAGVAVLAGDQRPHQLFSVGMRPVDCGLPYSLAMLSRICSIGSSLGVAARPRTVAGRTA